MSGRFTASLALALLMPAAAALAQELPPAAQKDLWCGLAFSIIAEEAPGDATPEQRALAERYAEGGAMLTDRARAVYLESGYGEDRLAAHIQTRAPTWRGR